MTTHCHRLFLFKQKKDKTHKKTTKRKQEKGRNLPSSSRFALSLLAFAFALLLLHFCFKCFFLAFFFSSRRKKNTKGKKP
jgi:hypothetical protein